MGLAGVEALSPLSPAPPLMVIVSLLHKFDHLRFGAVRDEKGGPAEAQLDAN